MGKTREYMDYLDDKIGIAPASSQEELEAARLIADVMGDHGLEPSIEELDTSPYAGAIRPILSILLTCCLIACGLVEGATHAVLIVVGLLLSVLLLFCHYGFDLFENFGPSSGSQNVVAVHRAEGDKVVKGARSIVIVAHLDTPRESLLHGSLARAHAPLKQAAPPCLIIACLAFLFQGLVFLPEMIVRILWVFGLIALIPVAALSVVTLIDRHLPCTDGANDNKSSVAALLSIMDHVHPSDDRVTAGETAARPRHRAGDESVSEPVPRRVEVVEEVFGVRHGAAVLNSLKILPETCEVIYEEPKVRIIEEQPVEIEEIAETNAAEDVQATEDQHESEEVAATEEIQLVVPDEPEEAVDESEELSAEDYEQPEEADFYQDRSPSRLSIVVGWIRDRAQDVRERMSSKGSDIEIEAGEDRRGRHEVRDEIDEWIDGADAQEYDSYDGPYAGEDEAAEDAYDEYGYEDEQYQDEYEGEYAGEYEDEYEGEYEDEYYDDDTVREDERPDDDEPSDEDELRPLASHQVGRRRAARETEPEEELENADETNEVADAEEIPEDEDSVDEDDRVDTAKDDSEVEQYDEASSDEAADYDEDGVVEGEDEWVEYEDDEYEDDDYEYEDEGREERAVETKAKPSVISRIKGWFSRLGSNASSKDDYDYDDEYEDDEYLDDDEYEDDEYVEGDESDEYVEETGDARYYEDEPEADSQDYDYYDDYEDEETEEDTAYDAGAVEEDEYGYAEYDDEYVEEDGEHISTESAEPLSEPLPDPNILHFDREEDDDILPRDTTGLDTISDSYDLIDSEQARVRPQADPAPIDDPNWGVSTFQPTSTSMNIARRAALFDLPDPTRRAVDPLRADDAEDEYEDDYDYEYEDDYEGYDEYPEYVDEENTAGDTSGRSDWKGGAAKRADLRDGADTEPSELADAMLELGDDFLVAHDVWFVVTGASAYNHAGIKAFLDEHRRDIRGAFLVNLESVGAGELGVYVREGLTGQRRADKRLVRMLKTIADDLHIGLETAAMTWDETDAATPMRSRVRAVSIVGLDDTNQPALSHTRQDIPENVNPKQVSNVVRMVCEMIRRS